jgi:FtsH-binding integral membrane protein
MVAAMAEPAPRIEHPNRAKAASKATRLIVIVLLLVSVVLMVIVTIGGWSAIAGAKPLQVVYVVLYAVVAYFVARWSRGVLPVVAALAIVLLIFAAVSTPAWFDRDGAGFTDPALPSGLLGLLTALLVPVQVLLIAMAMSGFRQAWNVEVEHGTGEADRPRPSRDEHDERRTEPGGGPRTAPA